MNDNKGCSTCKVGEEKYEEYYNKTFKKNLVQYDYRDTDGELFSCVSPTLEKAREKRNLWLKSRGREVYVPKAKIYYTSARGPWFCNIDDNHLPTLADLMKDYELMAEVDITTTGPNICFVLEDLFMEQGCCLDRVPLNE